MFGFLGRLLSIPDFVMDYKGNDVQGPGPGDDDTSGYSDPSWDTAGYGLGRIAFNQRRSGNLELTNPKGKTNICEIVRFSHLCSR